ncbi:hypothetical protein [Membranihabitans maritimus]|uniref:hypothetical protein n=1 Tax=Membranihabitans maritimus TaxID=2904244 RepID=UPI001F3A5384|nr:hypothetical protein [Membranihabitans maritimus]
MIEIKGKFFTSQYYSAKIPFFSLVNYPMSFAPKASVFYKTFYYPTRVIDLRSTFELDYSKRLMKYLRNIDKYAFEISRPNVIPDLLEMFQSTINAKNIPSYPPGIITENPNYYYSEIHEPSLGRLAAHMIIGDPENKIVMGYINASNYREMPDKKSQRISSIANKYLFHKDLKYFQKIGYSHYDMVGISEPMNQMKKEFGGKIIDTYTHTPILIHWVKKLFP